MGQLIEPGLIHLLGIFRRVRVVDLGDQLVQLSRLGTTARQERDAGLGRLLCGLGSIRIIEDLLHALDLWHTLTRH